MGSPTNHTEMLKPAIVAELAPERRVVVVASATILDLRRGLKDELPFVLGDPGVAEFFFGGSSSLSSFLAEPWRMRLRGRRGR